MATTLEPKNALAKTKSSSPSVFDEGSLSVQTIKVKKSWFDSSSPPKPLLIVAPSTQDTYHTYPVLLFFHGFCIRNNWYTNLLQHIASHGFIIVAPQFCALVSEEHEVKTAAKVTDWLSKGLESVLPENVFADLAKLAVLGHSRGGKTAFALALGYASASLKFSALIGLDPVAGLSPSLRCPPKILSYVPRAFDQSIPVAVIGAGLSNQSLCLIPPFAPNGVNHSEFFNESKPPCCYFLAKDYGHCDMLNDFEAALASLVCKSGTGSKELMRRGVGGVIVAFLNAYLGDEMVDLEAIADGSLAAPITLDPIIFTQE